MRTSEIQKQQSEVKCVCGSQEYITHFQFQDDKFELGCDYCFKGQKTILSIAAAKEEYDNYKKTVLQIKHQQLGFAQDYILSLQNIYNAISSNENLNSINLYITSLKSDQISGKQNLKSFENLTQQDLRDFAGYLSEKENKQEYKFLEEKQKEIMKQRETVIQYINNERDPLIFIRRLQNELNQVSQLLSQSNILNLSDIEQVVQKQNIEDQSDQNTFLKIKEIPDQLFICVKHKKPIIQIEISENTQNRTVCESCSKTNSKTIKNCINEYKTQFELYYSRENDVDNALTKLQKILKQLQQVTNQYNESLQRLNEIKRKMNNLFSTQAELTEFANSYYSFFYNSKDLKLMKLKQLYRLDNIFRKEFFEIMTDKSLIFLQNNHLEASISDLIEFRSLQSSLVYSVEQQQNKQFIIEAVGNYFIHIMDKTILLTQQDIEKQLDFSVQFNIIHFCFSLSNNWLALSSSENGGKIYFYQFTKGQEPFKTKQFFTVNNIKQLQAHKFKEENFCFVICSDQVIIYSQNKKLNWEKKNQILISQIQNMFCYKDNLFLIVMEKLHLNNMYKLQTLKYLESQNKQENKVLFKSIDKFEISVIQSKQEQDQEINLIRVNEKEISFTKFDSAFQEIQKQEETFQNETLLSFDEGNYITKKKMANKTCVYLLYERQLNQKGIIQKKTTELPLQVDGNTLKLFKQYISVQDSQRSHLKIQYLFIFYSDSRLMTNLRVTHNESQYKNINIQN